VDTQNSKKMIKIMIASGSDKPYYISKKGMSSNGCFIRINNATEIMPEVMIKNLFAKRVENSICNIKSRYQKLTFEQLKSYYQATYSILNAQLPKDLDLLTKESEYNYLAYLLSDKNDCSIKVDKYKGINRVDLIENEELGLCCIVKASNSVLDKLKINNNSEVEQSRLDIVAAREAVINAIVHNDYSSGIPPKFELFSDRLEITSVGAIPSGLSEENFFMGLCAPYNKNLMRVFRDLDMAAQKGDGIKLILQKNAKSVYHFSANNIRVVLPYTKDFIESKSNTNKEYTQVIKHSKKILLFCMNPKSRKSIQEHLKLKNRDHFRKNILLPLIESKQLLLTLPDKPTSPNQQFYTAQRQS
jgi:predicted HTH transcriptional regulator